jgi:peptide/nickel transport system ATP-binding protein
MITPQSSSQLRPVLEVSGLGTQFQTRHGAFKAIDDVSFSVGRGEVLGIVGESGSGKSVTAYSIMRLIESPGRVVSGSVQLSGTDLLKLSEKEMRAVRGGRIAMVFQDPMSTLHPMLTVEQQMVDAIRAHRPLSRQQARDIALEALESVRIPSAADRLSAYPHQLSGGTRQRVAIAIAMSNKPEVIIADEPTTALDVTTQAQILAEMRELCSSSGTSLIWITHDLAVVAGLAHRVAVMYAGQIVEQGTVRQILEQPAHPYTNGLLASVPSRNRESRRLVQIPGNVASAWSAPGCRFAPRCNRREGDCENPVSITNKRDGRQVRCLHPVISAAPTLSGKGKQYEHA